MQHLKELFFLVFSLFSANCMAQELKVEVAGVFVNFSPNGDTAYQIKLSSSPLDSIKICKVWIQQKRFYNYKTSNPQISYYNNTASFQLGVLILKDYRAIKYTREQQQKFKPPFKYKGHALVEYKIKNRIKYLIIEKFTVGLIRPDTDHDDAEPTVPYIRWDDKDSFIYNQE